MSQIASFATAAQMGAVVTLEGNSGGKVSPDGTGNINVVGGTGINIVGNPGTNTLTVSSTGTTVLTYTNVNTTPYTVLATDEYLSVDCSASAITVDLPNAPSTGRVYYVKDRTGSAASHNITITTPGGIVTIDGGTTFVMNTNYEAAAIIFNGTNYEVY